MEQKILLGAIFLLNFIFLIFFAQKFLPLLQASLINSDSKDFISKFEEILKKLDKISLEIENLNSKIENSKIDLSPISKEISNLKNQIQETKDRISEKAKEAETSILSESEKESEVKKEIETKTEIEKEPKISLSFPKEVFLNKEFEVLFSGENFENKSYDLKISVEFDGKILSQTFNEKEKRWQSSNYYLNNVFSGPSFSKIFKLKIVSENIFGDVTILAKVRETETKKLVTSTSGKIKIKQTQIQTYQPPSETQKECIDINTASLEELDKIYGVGPTIAQRIIETRPFTSVDDLIRVKGIGEKTLQKIKEQGLACVK